MKRHQLKIKWYCPIWRVNSPWVNLSLLFLTKSCLLSWSMLLRTNHHYHLLWTTHLKRGELYVLTPKARAPVLPFRNDCLLLFLLDTRAAHAHRSKTNTKTVEKSRWSRPIATRQTSYYSIIVVDRRTFGNFWKRQTIYRDWTSSLS